MSAMSYNSNATLMYLEQKGMTQSLLQALFEQKENFKHEYEKRFFIIGLSEMLLCQNLPASLSPLLANMLQEIIDMLKNDDKQRIKKLEKQARAEVQENANGDDDDDDDDDSDDEDDDDDDDDEDIEDDAETKNIDDDELGFKSKENQMEETKETGGETEIEIEHQDYEEDDLSFGSEANDMDGLFDLIVTMDLIQAPFKKLKSGEIFCDALRSLSQKSPQDMN